MLIPRTETNPTDQPAARPPRLLDQVRDAVRVRHYSYRTEEASLTLPPGRPDWAGGLITPCATSTPAK